MKVVSLLNGIYRSKRGTCRLIGLEDVLGCSTGLRNGRYNLVLLIGTQKLVANTSMLRKIQISLDFVKLKKKKRKIENARDQS